ncbi:MAG: helix-turn-helix transcriptional regulator [Oscillospiraceae bacterium]|nr:helix-turn-helix transcriptional regulator [Oscillospiraceae bacterium]MBP3209310.1 helix-turn-helix transcriptional regulator [Oscillospiraceae bacterium]
MAVSYRKLRYRLVDEKISMAKLSKMAGITDYAIRQISKDRDVSTEVLTKVCAALHCEVQDIVDFLPDEAKEQ